LQLSWVKAIRLNRKNDPERLFDARRWWSASAVVLAMAVGPEVSPAQSPGPGHCSGLTEQVHARDKMAIDRGRRGSRRQAGKDPPGLPLFTFTQTVT
jgi:hypothetical protein